MITSETPYKLAEIIRMTWPNLYNSKKPISKVISSVKKSSQNN